MTEQFNDMSISGCQGILLIAVPQEHRLTEQPVTLAEGEPYIRNEMLWPGSKKH